MTLKSPRIQSKKLRDSARGRACTLNTPVCNGNTETTVLCHVDSEDKGMGKKSHDFWACFGCSSCHEWIDRHECSEEDRLFYTGRAILRTQVVWIAEGLITIKGAK